MGYIENIQPENVNFAIVLQYMERVLSIFDDIERDVRSFSSLDLAVKPLNINDRLDAFSRERFTCDNYLTNVFCHTYPEGLDESSSPSTTNVFDRYVAVATTTPLSQERQLTALEAWNFIRTKRTKIIEEVIQQKKNDIERHRQMHQSKIQDIHQQLELVEAEAERRRSRTNALMMRIEELKVSIEDNEARIKSLSSEHRRGQQDDDTSNI